MSAGDARVLPNGTGTDGAVGRLERRRPRWRILTWSRSVPGRAGRLSGWSEPASSTPWPSSSTRRPAARCGPTGPAGRSPRATWPTWRCGGRGTTRDLAAGAVELCEIIRPRALLLENVRGLSTSRFSAYRQHVLDRLRELGYVPGWRLLQASDFGVPQLRPRTVLVALRPSDAPWFRWPSASPCPPVTVGETLGDLMAARGWPGAPAWARRANRIAPTIVGGSKKHGGAGLRPTPAKRAWARPRGGG